MHIGKKEDFGAFIPDSEKTGGIFIPKGDWSEKGNGMVISTAFGAEDYAEFLSVRSVFTHAVILPHRSAQYRN